jgi:hypothetical protein
MKLTTQKLLFDVFSACNLIEEFVAGHDFDSLGLTKIKKFHHEDHKDHKEKI